MDEGVTYAGITKRIMQKYYKKYAYAYGAKRSSFKENSRTKEFRRIMLLFLMFNIAASIAAIAIAILVVT